MRHTAATSLERKLVLALALVAAAMFPSLARAAIHVSLEPDSATVQPGDTVIVALTVFQADAEFNGFDAYVGFDPARFAYVSAPADSQIGSLLRGVCTNFFHQFVAHPDHVEIHLGLLCPNTFVTGPGEIYRVRLRVLAVTGPTSLVWQTGTEFYRAGFFVRPVESLPMMLFVQNPNTAAPPSGRRVGVSLETPWPNPYRGIGPLTLKFSLAGPAPVGFTILDAQGRRIASRAAEELGAGAHTFAWTGLRLSPGRYLVEMTAGTSTQAARSWVVVQ